MLDWWFYNYLLRLKWQNNILIKTIKKWNLCYILYRIIYTYAYCCYPGFSISLGPGQPDPFPAPDCTPSPIPWFLLSTCLSLHASLLLGLIPPTCHFVPALFWACAVSLGNLSCSPSQILGLSLHPGLLFSARSSLTLGSIFAIFAPHWQLSKAAWLHNDSACRNQHVCFMHVSGDCIRLCIQKTCGIRASRIWANGSSMTPVSIAPTAETRSTLLPSPI